MWSLRLQVVVVALAQMQGFSGEVGGEVVVEVKRLTKVRQASKQQAASSRTRIEETREPARSSYFWIAEIESLLAHSAQQLQPQPRDKHPQRVLVV